MTDDFAARVAGIGALAEPTRRALYLYVTSRSDAVSREEVAEQTQIPLHSVKFHLDRLADEGLLAVEFRRLSDRTGPGSGRPSKLYRRSDRQLTITLPERHYDVAGDVLAEAIDTSVADGSPIAEAVQAAAAARGRRFAADAPESGTDLERTAQVLAAHGYEPRLSPAAVALANCPFDSLARDHTELVCGLNLGLVGGVLEGLECTTLEAVLDPEPGRCCVRAVQRGADRA
jgi:predicted ArsR family transcriptional regulator